MPKQMLCQKCGDEFKAPTSNTKYCYTCRIHRDLNFLHETFARDCLSCGDRFYPLKGSHKKCMECIEARDSFPSHLCNLCHEHNRPAPGLTKTCVFCVTSSLKNRTKYKASLNARIDKIIKEKNIFLKSQK